jgi:hypothetical protein
MPSRARLEHHPEHHQSVKLIAITPYRCTSRVQQLIPPQSHNLVNLSRLRYHLQRPLRLVPHRLLHHRLSLPRPPRLHHRLYHRLSLPRPSRLAPRGLLHHRLYHRLSRPHHRLDELNSRHHPAHLPPHPPISRKSHT